MRIDGFAIMPIFSFGNAVTVFAGQNMGAGKAERISKGTKQACLMTLITTVILVGCILIFGRFIAGAFTNTQEVIDQSQRMLLILAPGYLALSIAMVLWGSIRGAGDAISPLWGSLINTVVVRVPSAYLFVHFLGTPYALMYSLLTAWTTNMILSIIIYRIGKWRNKGIVKVESEELGVES
jgi:Na+-driven multidrug efflux pump